MKIQEWGGLGLSKECWQGVDISRSLPDGGKVKPVSDDVKDGGTTI